MANYEDDLLRAGFVPSGVRPKTIQPDGSAQWENNSRLGRAAKILQTMIYQEQVKSQQRAERMKYQSDMYKSLRDAGYDPKTAYDAVQKNQMPSAAPAYGGLEEEGKIADIEYKRARTEQIRSGEKTPIYDQQGKLLYFIEKGGKILPKKGTELTPGFLNSRLKHLTENAAEDDKEANREKAAINKTIRSMTLPETKNAGEGQEELKDFSSQEQPKYKIGDTIRLENGKVVRIIGLDDPDYPEIEEVE